LFLKKSGVTDLPLHGGKAPHWLLSRMKNLSSQIFEVIVDEYGTEEVLRRLADPFWFQALSCTLAYDWHSSGTTTVVCGVLKSAIDPEKLGFCVCGGKGKTSKKTLTDIDVFGNKTGLGDQKIESIKHASRMCAKVDNATIQDGYQLYHHSMIVTEEGSWAVIQQGMNPEVGYARRYQWLCGVKTFVEEPHEGIVCDISHEDVLNLTAKKSEGCRKVSTDLSCEKPEKIKRAYETIEPIRPKNQTTLLDFCGKSSDNKMPSYRLPKRVNWNALKQAYEIQPKNYEEMIGISGIGPATVRGLALVSELIYGERPSWKDPVKYSFAYGGKDGVPYPVDKRAMDESVNILKNAIRESKVDKMEQIDAIRRLKSFAKGVPV